MRRAALAPPRRLTDFYRLIGKIGEGTYGLVFKAELVKPSTKDKKEDDVFAVKMVKSHKDGHNEVVLSMATLREIKILRELHHINIVDLHDVHVDPIERSLALVFEYAHHDLRDIIVQSKNRPLPEYTRKCLMYQILQGMKYMHDNWILHRDIKPQNILVVGQGSHRGVVKIADFGLARIYQSPVKGLVDVERVVVTLWYRSPELILGAKHYTTAVDIYSTGCIFAELLNGRELFCGKEVEGRDNPFQVEQMDKICSCLGVPTPKTWPGVELLPEYPKLRRLASDPKKRYPTNSELRKHVAFGTGPKADRLYDLVSRMLEMNPERRISAKDALKHPYFTDTEPRPQQYAFDEPGREPLVFTTQKVDPVPESVLQKLGGGTRKNVSGSKRSRDNVSSSSRGRENTKHARTTTSRR